MSKQEEIDRIFEEASQKVYPPISHGLPASHGMELRIVLNGRTVLWTYGADVSSVWNQAIYEFPKWFQRYEDMTPQARANVLMPADWEWKTTNPRLLAMTG